MSERHLTLFEFSIRCVTLNEKLNAFIQSSDEDEMGVWLAVLTDAIRNIASVSISRREILNHIFSDILERINEQD